MAESIKEDVGQFEVKEEIASVQGAIHPSTTVYKQEDDVKMDNTEIKGKQYML